jgi:AcrR family transcriptional regulator
MAAKRKMQPSVRRPPAAARVHILDAADAVFARSLPDAVGLREIATEAKVSHGLVTHYFGSYEGLIEAAIGRRLANAKQVAFARLAEATFVLDETPLLGVLTDLLADQTLTRLVAWSFLTQRKIPVFGAEGQLGELVTLMQTRLAKAGVVVARERLEFAMLMAIAAIVGWSVSGPTLEQAIGRPSKMPTSELREKLQAMIRAYVTPGR